MSAKEKTEFQYIDKPNYGLKRSTYIRKVVKLDNKDDQFSTKKFQKVRKCSTKKDVLDSFRRIGMSFDKVKLSKLPKENILKVCFVTIANFDDTNESLGVAPLNDAYLFAFIHYKLGYKVIFLYNPDKSVFVKSLKFLLAKTSNTLTIYYSGNDSFSKISQVNHGIQFNYKENITDTELGILFRQKKDARIKIFIFSDCTTGGSIFSMKNVKKDMNLPNIVSISANKSSLMPKEKRMSHGLLTYYFCKLIMNFADSSVKKMIDLLNMSMRRFGITFTPIVSDEELLDRQMISGASEVFGPSKA